MELDHSMNPHEQLFGPVRFLPGPNRGKYPYCHSVYIEGDGILIDPASDRDRLKRLRAEQPVREIWLSHWHEDHFMHLDLFDDLPLKMHPADSAPLSNMSAFMDAYDLGDPQLRELFETMLVDMFHFRERAPDGTLNNGDVIALESVTVAVHHTPGHTPGHLCFHFHEPDVLFLGDYDLTAFGPWYGDRDGSIDQTITAVDAMQAVNAGTLLTGHEQGVFTDNVPSLWDDYRAVVERRENDLLAALKTPMTLDEIIDCWIAYGKAREPQAFYRFAESALMKKHLQRLMDRQRVVQRDDGRYRQSQS